MVEQPRGTVSFLFTDIEGSTTLLAGLGRDAYAGLLAEHQALLRAAFARHRGYEVNCEGDAFFVAFEGAADAAAGAIEAQRALAAWGRASVRMGLHTGEPLVVTPKYVGLEVHRAARIMAAAHGGQLLLSETTAALVGGSLPPGTSLRDLGPHRLRDIEEPERLVQLTVDGREEFPPPRAPTLSVLPQPATAFLGRGRELAEATETLGRTRLLTLTGPGGTGKTRLALELARCTASGYRDGAFWVDLAAVRDPALVLPAIAQALDAHGDLAELLAGRQLLLVLDNLEQVIAASATLAALLAACPELTVIATSREPLRVSAELELAVPPLREDDATSLFRERAEAIRPGVPMNGEVEAICSRLDGLPLAIELAAARVRTLTPASILERLEHRLPLLTGGARDLPERQQTLRSTIAWSHDLLDAAEQRLFARLAVFAGGWTLDAAEAICDATVDGLESLVAKSLVRLRDGRCSMLETIREFAANELAGSGELDDLERRHCAYFVELANADVRRYVGPAELEAHAHVAAEWENLIAALASAVESGNAPAATSLCHSLAMFWLDRSEIGECLAWAERALALAGDDPALRAPTLWAAGESAMWIRDMPKAHRYLDELLELGEQLGDPGAVVDACCALVGVATPTS